MCLQWCHVRAWVIDNDLACIGCDRGDPERLPDAWSCVGCVHHSARDGQIAICGLTHETLPVCQRCCHWQTARTTMSTLVIGDANIAPWIGGTARDVFVASPSAPPIVFDNDRIIVDLDDLSVPLVYGVPAPDWDAALGWELAMPLESGTPLDDMRQQAITNALEALEHGAFALEQMLNELAAELDAAGVADLPEGWLDILTQLIVLGRNLYGDHATILAQFDQLASDACISR